jgi:hypothetical protein
MARWGFRIVASRGDDWVFGMKKPRLRFGVRDRHGKNSKEIDDREDEHHVRIDDFLVLEM